MSSLVVRILAAASGPTTEETHRRAEEDRRPVGSWRSRRIKYVGEKMLNIFKGEDSVRTRKRKKERAAASTEKQLQHIFDLAAALKTEVITFQA